MTALRLELGWVLEAPDNGYEVVTARNNENSPFNKGKCPGKRRGIRSPEGVGGRRGEELYVLARTTENSVSSTHSIGSV